VTAPVTGAEAPEEGSGTTPAEPLHRPAVGLVLVLAVAALLALGLVGLPRAGAALPDIARYAMRVALPRWHITEPVNEVVYGTRGFDTFGETFLLLAAVVSVVLLSRRREPRSGYLGEEEAGQEEQAEVAGQGGESAAGQDAGERQAREAEEREGAHDQGEGEGGPEPPAPAWTPDRDLPDDEPLGTPGPETADAMTVVVRTAIRVASPLLAMIGAYLVAWGYSPGGGFPAGAVALGVILLLYTAFGYRKIARAVRARTMETIEMVGAGVIILTELLGLVLRGSFSANWLPLAHEQAIRSGGVLQLFSGGELIEVATGLTIAVFGLLGMAHDWTSDTDGEPSDAGRGRS
jgi:multicomponent Na+:H+ antiporter subunit B